MDSAQTCWECGRTYRVKGPGSFCPHCVLEFEYKLNKNDELFYILKKQHKPNNGVNIKKDGQTNRREKRKKTKKMTIEQFAEQNGFVRLTSQSHPRNGQVVQILGNSISKDLNVEKIQWFFDGTNHAYKWITHEFNRGIMTTSLDYWREI